MSDWAFRQEQNEGPDDGETYAPCDGCGVRTTVLYATGCNDGDLCPRCFDRAAETWLRAHPQYALVGDKGTP